MWMLVVKVKEKPIYEPINLVKKALQLSQNISRGKIEVYVSINKINDDMEQIASI